MGIHRLDQLKEALTYLPLTLPLCSLLPSYGPRQDNEDAQLLIPKNWDCDVILAAQARGVAATVVTDNIGHLSQFVEAQSLARYSSRSVTAILAIHRSRLAPASGSGRGSTSSPLVMAPGGSS